MRVLRSFVAGSALLLATAGVVAADAVYHTERLALRPVGTAVGTGMVVNIHPNGGVVYARERYALRHADPSQTYQVWLLVYTGNLTCSGTPALTIPTATLTTSARGNGTSQVVFRPADVAALRGSTVSAKWQVTADGTLTHETSCTVIVLD